MSEIEIIIDELFDGKGWGIPDTIEAKKAQLHKNLTDQVNGWWSGHTAYHIMTKGGFLVDGEVNTYKQLTALGEMFMKSMGGLKNHNVNKRVGKLEWKDE